MRSFSVPSVPESWLVDSSAPAALLVQARDVGEAGAQLELGLEYLRGESTRSNPRLAAYWLHRTTLCKHGKNEIRAKANYLLAVLTREGEGVRPCFTQYLRHLLRAAKCPEGPEAATSEFLRLRSRGLLGVDPGAARESTYAHRLNDRRANACVAASSADVAVCNVLFGGALGLGVQPCGQPRQSGTAPGSSRPGNPNERQQAEELFQVGLQLYEPGVRSGFEQYPRRDCAQAAECLSAACAIWRAEIRGVEAQLLSRDRRCLQYLGGIRLRRTELLMASKTLYGWAWRAWESRGSWHVVDWLRKGQDRRVKCRAWSRWWLSIDRRICTQIALDINSAGTACLSRSIVAWRIHIKDLRKSKRLLGSTMCRYPERPLWQTVECGRPSIGTDRVVDAAASVKFQASVSSCAFNCLSSWKRFVADQKIGCGQIVKTMCKVLRRAGWWRSWHRNAQKLTAARRLGRYLMRATAKPRLGWAWVKISRWSENALLEHILLRKEALVERMSSMHAEQERLESRHRQTLETQQRRLHAERSLNAVLLEVESKKLSYQRPPP